MKIASTFFSVLLLMVAGCSTLKPAADMGVDPETVLVTYHVKAGSEVEFEEALWQTWKIYQIGHLTTDQPHTVIRTTEDNGKLRYVEIFTWASHAVPDHAPQPVIAAWARLTALCENRDGHNGLEGGSSKRPATPMNTMRHGGSRF